MPMEGMPMDGSEPHVDPPGTPPHDDGDASGAGMKMDEAKPHPHAPGTPAHDDQAASAPKATTAKPVVHRPADGPVESTPRPDERRVGNEWGSTCSTRWCAYHLKKITKSNPIRAQKI